MNKMQIHQFVCTLDYGDAVSNDVLSIKQFLNNSGFESEIYAENFNPKVQHECHKYKKYHNVETDIIIHHFSLGTDFDNYVNSFKNKKILIYHNITPSNYFSHFNDELEYRCRIGRKQLAKFSQNVILALADSEYSEQELIQLGFKNTGVLPIIVDFEKYEEPAQEIIDKFYDGTTNLLFVGRISPNKKQEDIIKTFFYYKKMIDPNARLFLVGSYKGLEKYYDQLQVLIEKLDLSDVYITGKIKFEELLAYYKIADVFLSMSEHEGFCVPLLEAMNFKIPIVAYNSTAVPYTLGDSGILVNNKNYAEIAEMIKIMIDDNKFRKNVVEKQEKRLKDFEKSKVEMKLKEYINRVSTA